MDGVRQRFAIQKNKKKVGMVLCNWLAISKKLGGGDAELKNEIETNCDVNTKL